MEEAERDLAAGARAFTAKLLADAKPTEFNAFKIPLVERTLDAILGQAKGA
jgi:xanthine dehydrogenase YagS FAD-binding subunit